MEFKDKLNLLLSREKLNQADLAQKIGVSRQAVQVWASGRSVPKGTNLAKICEFFGVSPEWFSNQSSVSKEEVRVKSFVPGEDTPPEGYVSIPEYQLTFSAGNGSEPEWEQTKKSSAAWYKVDYLRSKGVNPARCRRAKVVGDSMEPLLFSGDTILWEENVDPHIGCNRIVDGSIYVLAVDGALRIKKLAHIKNGIRIISINPAYPPEDYFGDEADGIRLFGRVIESSHTFK